MAHDHRPPRCYFFLSYARGDDNASIERFFNDLSADVRSHAGLAPNVEVGFIDVHSMELGVQWSTRLMRDLVECRVFVALVSPRYLRSEMCGKEWGVFADRLDRHTSPDGEPPPALLPLLWLPPPTLPDAVEELQYHNDHLPKEYVDKGLRQMIRLDRFRDNYVEFVDTLAQQIVRTAEANHVPTATRSLKFSDVRSVFHATRATLTTPEPGMLAAPPAALTSGAPVPPAALTSGAPAPPAAQAPGAPAQLDPPEVTLPCEPPVLGSSRAMPTLSAPRNSNAVPRQPGPGDMGPGQSVPVPPPPAPELTGQSVCFVVAAPSRTDVETGALASLGRDIRFYGPTPVDWTPYLPELAMSLAAFAQDIAEHCQFDSVAVDVSSLPQIMALARETSQAVILLVDLWVTSMEEQRRLLKLYDLPTGAAGEAPTAVMVPASASDPHTQAQRRELDRSLRSVLENRMVTLDDVMFRSSILSHRAFDADLQVVLEKVRNRSFRTRIVHHRPPGTLGSRPILQGP